MTWIGRFSRWFRGTPRSDRTYEVFPPDAAVTGAPMMGREMASLFSILLPLLNEQKSLILHLFSYSSGEGVSSVARELAAAVATRDWCRVLLIDAGGGVSRTLDCRPHSSLSTRDGAKGWLDFPIYRASFGMASFDVAGLSRKAGGEFGNPNAIKALYEQARERYRLILVDLPAVTASNDTVAISFLADGVLFVIEAGRTRIPAIKYCKASIEATGGQITGVVFNKKTDYIPGYLYKRL